MAIVITVEDGSIVVNANSYISINDAKQFALERGILLPDDADSIAAMIIKATDYLESLSCKFKGEKVDNNQSLQWPRQNVIIDNAEHPKNEIPKNLIKAAAHLVIAVNSGIDLLPNISLQDYITKEKVGPIETWYADPTKVGVMPTFTVVEALLKSLMDDFCLSGLTIHTIRV